MSQLISTATVPQHIAIIMDGNRRWAKKNKMSRTLGHKQGIKAVQNIVEQSKNIGIRYLTLYAFSLENWKRSKTEIDSLMAIFREYLDHDVEKLIKNDVRIIFIGRHDKLDEDIKEKMKNIEKKSVVNKFHFIIALSYGARDEILNSAIKFSKLYDEKKYDNIEKAMGLFTSIINPHNIPNPDLLIRTGGEQRLSNFLLWQMAYTELFFTDKLWPDFNEHDLMSAIESFNRRERRYGK